FHASGCISRCCHCHRRSSISNRRGRDIYTSWSATRSSSWIQTPTRSSRCCLHKGSRKPAFTSAPNGALFFHLKRDDNGGSRSHCDRPVRFACSMKRCRRSRWVAPLNIRSSQHLARHARYESELRTRANVEFEEDKGCR